MNKIEMIGRISRNIDLRRLQSGKEVANFGIAVNNPKKKDESGNTQADFFDCIVWGTQAINLQKYQEKGDLIAIEGRLANQYWQDNQGNNHYKNIVICESIEYLAKKNNNAQSDTQFNSNQEALSRAMNEESFVDFGNQIELDDDLELPF